MSDNPFLLPPRATPPAATPPEKAPPEKAPLVIPDAAPASTDYIAVPASVESATHRIQRPAPEPDPAEATPSAGPESSADAVSEETRIAPPRRTELLLADGTRVPLTRPVLLGRDPAGIPDRPEAELLAVTDPGKTVSKTHALLEAAPGGVRVRELHSTNGVAIDSPAGRKVLPAGGEGLAAIGSTILLGSFAISVVAG
jgi:hypothetical protein